MASETDSPDILLRCALDLFGRHGFDGTSTRAIAAAAGKPMSAITYHFGGKEELYVAASRYLSARIAEQIMPTMEAATTAAATGGPADTRNGIRNIFSAFTSMMLNPESSAWARYVVREQMDPTRAFDELYAAPMGPLLTTISGMLQRLSGDRLDPEEARIRVIALFGQAFAFRVARALALRMTGWSEISAPQADAIRFVILSQLDATLDSLER